MKHLENFTCAGLGILLTLFGCAGSLVTSLAVVDPAGVPLSNDADPFGTTPPMSRSTTVLAIFVGIVFLESACLSLLRKRMPP